MNVGSAFKDTNKINKTVKRPQYSRGVYSDIYLSFADEDEFNSVMSAIPIFNSGKATLPVKESGVGFSINKNVTALESRAVIDENGIVITPEVKKSGYFVSLSCLSSISDKIPSRYKTSRPLGVAVWFRV